MDSRTTVRNEPIRPTPRFFPQNVSSTAVGLSGVTAEFLNSNKLNIAWITSSGDFRYRWDGQASPTTAVGHIYLSAGSPLQLVGRRKILDFRMIAGGAIVVSCTLDNTSDAGGLQ